MRVFSAPVSLAMAMVFAILSCATSQEVFARAQENR